VPVLEYEGEAPASSGDLYRAKSPSAVETPPARDTLKEVSLDLAISKREEHSTNTRITSPHPSGTSDVAPQPRRPTGSSTSERRNASTQEDQSSVALTASKPPRMKPDAVGPDLLEGNSVPGRDDQQNLVSAVPGALPRTPESRPGPSHPGDSDPSDYKIMTGKEAQRHPSRATERHLETPPKTYYRTEAGPTPGDLDLPVGQSEDPTIPQKQKERRNVAPAVSGRSQTMSEKLEKPELLHPAGSGPTRRGVNAVPPRPVLSENPALGLPSAEDESESRHRTQAGPTPSEVSLGRYHPAGTSTSERENTSAQEDQDRNNPLTVPQASQKMPDAAGHNSYNANIVPGREDQRTLDSDVPGAIPRTPKARRGQFHPHDSGSSDRRIVIGKEDQRHPSGAMARHPQIPPDTRHGIEADPTPFVRDAPAERPQDATRAEKQEERSNVVPAVSGRSQTTHEDSELLHSGRSGEASQHVFHPVRTLLDPVQGETPPPRSSARAQASLAANDTTPSSNGIPDRPAVLDAPPVAPRMIRPRMKSHMEQGGHRPRVDAPESSAPTIRVAIGRIEVRAITPPPSPLAQQTAPARPGPTLSLDDYLRQRNGKK
jgi:hypothetical protein